MIEKLNQKDFDTLIAMIKAIRQEADKQIDRKREIFCY